jgi:hypothetical protein
VGIRSKLRRSESELIALVGSQSSSGLTIAEFCHKHDLTLHHFRRIRELRGKPAAIPSFIKVAPSKEPCLTLSIKGYELSFPAELLPQVMQQLQEA